MEAKAIMTNHLKCSVENCANYQDHRCCLPGIEVAGPQSKSRQETCCNSYLCAGQCGGATNSTAHNDPNPVLEIRCSAKKCVHNHGGACDADCVCVGIGNYDTTSKHETQCETFAPHF